MINILQVLCPKRHCLFAYAYDEVEYTEAEIKAKAETVFEEYGVNRWCGICQSRDIAMEAGHTAFKTIEEALPHIQELAEEQQRYRERRDILSN